MKTLEGLATEIVAIAQERGKGVTHDGSSDDYTFEEGVMTLVAGIPLPLMGTIRDAFVNAAGDSDLLEFLSALIRQSVLPYLEMLDECDPNDPDTPAPLTPQELVDLELKVKVAPFLVHTCLSADRPYSMENIKLVSAMSVTIRFVDGVLQGTDNPLPYEGDEAVCREKLTIAALIVFAVHGKSVPYVNSIDSKERTDWLLDIYENREVVSKYARVCYERGTIDWDLLTVLDEADGALALSEGAL